MKTVEIKVEQGILRGEDTESKLIFKGVPYAKPPIGNLRFSSPQAPDRWLGVRDALEYSRIFHSLRHRIRFIVKSSITMSSILILK